MAEVYGVESDWYVYVFFIYSCFVDDCLFVCWYSDGDERLMVGAFVRSESRYWSVFVG